MIVEIPKKLIDQEKFLVPSPSRWCGLAYPNDGRGFVGDKKKASVLVFYSSMNEHSQLTRNLKQ
jgi:hypothetical protein